MIQRILLLLILFSSCNSTEKSNSTETTVEPTYYTIDDFSTLDKYDIHVHINTEESFFIEQAQEDNFRFLDIVDDRPFGLPMNDQERIAILHLNGFPKQMDVATTFSVSNWNNESFIEETLTKLKKSFENGAKAVKIWKNIGMDLRDENGKFVMVDNPKLEPIFNFLVENGIPVIGHNGEPKDCWLPLEEMTFSKSYYGSHPEYHMYLHPEYPSYEDQINARDNMLAKYPNLRFTGAHLGSLEWDLDELSKRLDRFPNMWVDLSRMNFIQLHTFNDWQKTHDFFIKYQDRFVYATDRAVNEASDPAELKERTHESWLRDWIFYATDNDISLRGHGELKGLKLPREVIDKIYYKNAQKWLNGHQ